MNNVQVFKGISDAEYNALPGVRSTILSTIDRKTLAHAKEKIDNPPATTDDFKLGQAFHDLMLRPDIFNQRWGICPAGTNFTTKEGKAVKEAMISKYGDQYLKLEPYEELLRMKTGLMEHKYISKCLENIIDTELSIQWHSEVEGMDEPVLCKCRIDAVIKIGDSVMIADLKTTRDASRKEFENSCINYGYLIQSAHYIEGAKAAGLIEEFNQNFLHMASEKEAPYLSALYVLDDQSLDVGEQRRQRAMRQYVNAIESGNWAGYSEEPETISAPHWFYNFGD